MTTKIAVVGEAWGEQEARQRTPFVGPAGWQLNGLLEEADIRRADCLLTNVFQFQPPNNDIKALCVSKKEDTLGLPPIAPSKYLHARYKPELDRLAKELEAARPNIILALGNVASWALLRNTGISKIRGTVAPCVLVPGLKVLPTYHPAAILRQYELRPITVVDMMKAKWNSEYPEIRRPERTVYIEPELKDLDWFFDEYVEPCQLLSIDIETFGNQITCIGFAPSQSVSFVVPFLDWRKPGYSYWPDLETEILAWRWVKKVLAHKCLKLFHNAMYDVTFLWRHYGIPTNNLAEDSMLLSHSRQPESLKGLGYLGSIYSDEASWKLLNKRSKTIKRDN